MTNETDGAAGGAGAAAERAADSAHGATLVRWREWGEAAFAEASSGRKPILLDIGAVWCHWCHVMDTGIPGDPVHTGTYSDPAIASLINERFVPVKVDNDRRPDINARYNMGGWPTTAFLTPGGDTLYGETYVPPTRMLELCRHVADYYRDNAGDIAERLRAHAAEEAARERPVAGALSPAIANDALDAAASAFDFAYGGFGTQPKFPQPDALELLVSRYRADPAASGAADSRLIVEKTLAAMAGGGMYDHHAGGFFRYSTTRDWSVPHYEKMLEDNARLSRVCLLAAAAFQEERWADVARDVHGFLLDVLFDPQQQTFAGSQDAGPEEAYYGLPLEERALAETPYIDRTVYAGWNALAVGSLVQRYRQYEEAPVLDVAERCYAFLRASVWPRHYRAPETALPDGPEWLLADVAALLDAALDLAEAAPRERQAAYLSDAHDYAAALLGPLLSQPGGDFLDMPIQPGALGALAQPKPELASSAAASRALLRWAAYTGDPDAARAAGQALRAHAGEAGGHGLFAAGYALAVAQALAEPLHVVIVGGTDAQADALRRAAWHALRGAPAAIERVAPGAAAADGQEYPERGGEAAAYVCVGTACTLATTPEAVEERLRENS